MGGGGGRGPKRGGADPHEGSHAPLGGAVDGRQRLGGDAVVHGLLAAQGPGRLGSRDPAQLALLSGKVHQVGHKLHAAAQRVGEGVGRVGVHAQHAPAAARSVVKGSDVGGEERVHCRHGRRAGQGVRQVLALRAGGGQGGCRGGAHRGRRRSERVHLGLAHPLAVVLGGGVRDVQQARLQQVKVGPRQGRGEAHALLRPSGLGGQGELRLRERKGLVVGRRRGSAQGNGSDGSAHGEAQCVGSF